MKKRILSVGEIIWDVYSDRRVIGGAPLNFAAHAARCGAESTLLSAVGADELGDEAIEALTVFGVETELIQRSEKPTGRCLVSLNKDAVPQYELLRDMAYDDLRLTPQEADRIRAKGFDTLYFGTLIQRAPTSRRTLWQIVNGNRFETIFCDVNLRKNCYDKESVLFCLEHATILKVSMEEEPTLRAFGLYAPAENTPNGIARELCRRFRKLKLVLITLGKDGAYAYEPETERTCLQPAIGNCVASTVGAGDSFSAAFLTDYLSGKDLNACMRKAAIVSGFVVAHMEAVPEYDISTLCDNRFKNDSPNWYAEG
ncbi:MAG TPA: hypothetical protein DDW30_01125 [Clostridiales bacterium]|nr:hypothetical protein [Clostridiales bacterium]